MVCKCTFYMQISFQFSINFFMQFSIQLSKKFSIQYFIYFTTQFSIQFLIKFLMRLSIQFSIQFKFYIQLSAQFSIQPIENCEWRVEYAHHFPACRMRRLKGCPDGSASMNVGLRRAPVYPLLGCRSETPPTF